MRRQVKSSRVRVRIEGTINTINRLTGKELELELDNCNDTIVEHNGYDIKIFEDGTAIVLRVFKGIGWLVFGEKLVQFWINWNDIGRYYHANYTDTSVMNAFYNSKNIYEFLECLEYYQPQTQ